MSKLTLDEADKVKMTGQLKSYLEQEFDLSVGAFDAEFLLDFITDNFSATYYNKGLRDAQQVMQEKMETVHDALYELELPT